MRNPYRYTLDNSSKKFVCPSCGKKRFVRYIDLHLDEYLPIIYGRCDRAIKCTYKLNPYLDNYHKSIEEENDRRFTQKTISNHKFHKNVVLDTSKLVPIPTRVLKLTLSGYKKNNFFQNLLHNIPFPFEPEDLDKVIEHYYLGTIKKGFMEGAITFPFIDVNYKIRAIQVKSFDSNNHSKSTNFLHSILEKYYNSKKQALPEWLRNYNNNHKKIVCLFGEHILNKYPNNPVALVEAPKTAIYGTLYFGFPQDKNDLIWLAVYNLNSLNLSKCQVLKGRKVILFPDLSMNGRAFKLWKDKASIIETQLPGSKFIVSQLLERLAKQEDRKSGKDLADYLIKLNWNDFREN